MHSFTEENYLKAIYKLEEKTGGRVNNTDLAKALAIHSATVTDMLKKMSERKWILYEKSKGFKLTGKGRKSAVGIIRRHRLWEVFLVSKLEFGWDEVHEIAEQLEHVQSEDLINRLDSFLGYPKADPHGDPIPDENGEFMKSEAVLLSKLKAGSKARFAGITDHSTAFLSYLDKIGLALGDTIKIGSIEEFDQSYILQLKSKKEIIVSSRVTNGILVVINY
ncbi:metal-dependent transcriptional regulator [Daejeonella sp.]|uniref:metal-dependent transcriptional regulator n=1 Tax=Daejeonella sp. TaxID=2805397 RepID=UPI00271D3578|nr:metal-dependent transcriptional regulator [Daejeonella sp.]MDO8991688.1 metal-dependent transcriptional regulator [Daejeonella sp.]MDP2412470.1 metal-dependent transcriptional regulator [Daejeonella sp.]